MELADTGITLSYENDICFRLCKAGFLLTRLKPELDLHFFPPFTT